MQRDKLGRFLDVKLEKHPLWKGRIKRTGYWYIKKPNHPYAGKQKYVAEHRLIMEKHLNRYLFPYEVVHHKNGNIEDNRLENLELFDSHGTHTKKAHPEIFEKQRIAFKGKHFSPSTEFRKNDPRLIGNKYRHRYCSKPSY